jgi:hypothetical protein
VVRIEFLGIGHYEIGVSFLEMGQTSKNAKNEVSRYLLNKLGQQLR